MSFQCQAITLKGAQCKRKASTNCNFCKQHSQLQVDQPSHPVETQDQPNLVISNIVHGPRAFVSKLRSFPEEPHPEGLCTFKNVCGEYICTKSKIYGCRFCEEHQTLFNSHEWFVNVHAFNYVRENNSFLIFFDRHIRTTIQFFNQMSNISHEFVQFSNTEGCNKIKILHQEWNREKLLNIARGKYHNIPENHFNYRFSEDMKKLESFGKFFDIDARIRHEQNILKLEKINVNLLSEIYMKDPHPQSKKLQPVFSKDIFSLVSKFM